MGFAIKIIIPKKIAIFGQCSEENNVRYFSQSIESVTNKGLKNLILLCDGNDPGEVNVSDTLIEAEEKLNVLRKQVKYSVFKIIEYPECDTIKQNLSGDGDNGK